MIVQQKINVTRSSLPSFQEYCKEIQDLWETRWLTNAGVKHKVLEDDLKEFLVAKCLTLYTNGHLALEYAIQALGLRGEIITTPFTFASTTQAIIRSGCTPVFCDIDPLTYTMDPQKIECLISEKTTAIMPVHVYGNLCNVKEIQSIADKFSLKVIYDAAHAFGVSQKGISAANFGDVSMFSFHATKVFHTIEGGCLTYHDEALTKRLDELKNFGISGPEEVSSIGGNAKMNEFQAAMGICNLRHLDAEIAKRGAVVSRYHERLSNVKGIRLNSVQPETKPNHAYFPVLFDGFKYTRDEVFEKLAKEGITARKYFYPLTNSFTCYNGMEGFDPDATPIAQHVASHILTLPLYADLALRDVDSICSAILD